MLGFRALQDAHRRWRDVRRRVKAGLTTALLVSAKAAVTGSMSARFIVVGWLPRRVA